MPPPASEHDAALKAFADTRIAPLLARLRTARALAARQIRWGLLAGLAIGLALALLLHALRPSASLVTLMAALAPSGALLGMLPGWLGLGKARARFARACLARIAAFLGLDYVPKGFAPPHFQSFTASGLLPPFDRKAFAHLLHGTHKGIEASIYQATLKQWRTRRTGKTTTRELVTVFEGQLVHTPWERAFFGQTLILRDKGWFNALDGLNAPRGMKRVRLADPHFEEIFEVYSTDQVEGRYLVDPLFMERLIAMAEQNRKRSPNLAFVDGALLMTLSGQGDIQRSLEAREKPAHELVHGTVTAIDTLFEALKALKGG